MKYTRITLTYFIPQGIEDANRNFGIGRTDNMPELLADMQEYESENITYTGPVIEQVDSSEIAFLVRRRHEREPLS